MPAKPLDHDEARVLMAYRDGYIIPITQESCAIDPTRLILVMHLSCDGMLHMCGGLTRAGALALAAYEKENQRG